MGSVIGLLLSKEKLNTCHKVTIALETMILVTAVVLGILALNRPDLINPTTTNNLLIVIAGLDLLAMIQACCIRAKGSSHISLVNGPAAAPQPQMGQRSQSGRAPANAAAQIVPGSNIHTIADFPGVSDSQGAAILAEQRRLLAPYQHPQHVENEPVADEAFVEQQRLALDQIQQQRGGSEIRPESKQVVNRASQNQQRPSDPRFPGPGYVLGGS